MTACKVSGGRVNKPRLVVAQTPMPYGSALIVDDVETNLYVAVGLLKPYKINVETAKSGFEAIELIRSGRVYDIVFMDHMMPGMDGIEATAKLRAMGYDRPVVALTANALSGNGSMFGRHGFDGYIPKPINLTHLNDILNRFILGAHIDGVVMETGDDGKLLKVFKGDAEEALIKLHRAIPKGDVKAITHVAHGMKTALANVGEDRIALIAAELEGSNGAGAEAFARELEQLYRRLSQDEAPQEEDGEEREDSAYLNAQMEVIEAACAAYDERVVYSALNRLRERKWKAATTQALEDIGDMLFLQSDFEAAGEKARQIIQMN